MELPIIMASVVQSLATVTLVLITWRYVQHTKKLVELQIEPRLDIIVPRSLLGEKPKAASLLNASGSEIDQIHLEATVGYTDKNDGILSPLRKAIAVHQWDKKLKPGDQILFDFSKYFTPQSRATARHELPDSLNLLEDVIFLSVSARRVVDGKEIAFSEPYGIITDDEGNAQVSKIGKREPLESLERLIVRPVNHSK